VAGRRLVVRAAESSAVTDVLSRRLLAIGKADDQRVGDRAPRLRGAFMRRRASYRASSDVAVEAGNLCHGRVSAPPSQCLGSAGHLELILLGLEPSVLGRVITFAAKRLAFRRRRRCGSHRARAVRALHRPDR